MWQKNVRYLDYNASSGVKPEVVFGLTQILSSPLSFANPSSLHRAGQEMKQRLILSQNQIAKSLGADPGHLIFTSSGTESNQTILRHLAETCEAVLIGAGEHSASFDLIGILPNAFELPLEGSGQIQFAVLKERLNEFAKQGLKKIGLSLGLANNETGVLLDQKYLQSVLDQSPIEVVLHLDGAQAWGKIPLDCRAMSAEFFSFSSHKIGAPAGVGVIVHQSREKLVPLLIGSQMRGQRGGTENALGIFATGLAAEALDASKFAKATEPLVASLESQLIQAIPGLKIWGAGESRVPNTSRFSFSEFSSYQNWVELLDLKGFAVSHGSACQAHLIAPSRVLLKMGASPSEALNSLRISFGETIRLTDVDELVQALVQLYLQKKSSL